MIEQPSPAERVLGYFTDDGFGLAVKALRSYYGPGYHYTGSAFDQLVSRTSPDMYTSSDMLAVSMLSVTVPPRAALHLLHDAEIEDLLRRIPSDASIWRHPELLDRDRPAWRLWSLVEALNGVGETIASKLLAAKRPELIPIFDKHVNEALSLPTSKWAFWQQVARDDRSRNLLESIEAAKSEAQVPGAVSPLRAIDVVVWMREHGWKTHADQCTLGCNFDGF